MAWAQLNLAARFDPKAPNSPLHSHIYVIASDGDLQEGVTSEAASFAGLHAISNLTVIYDDNQISIDGDAQASFDEDVVARYLAYGWDSVKIYQLPDGSIDINSLDQALTAARKSDKPTLIVLRTAIAYPSPNMTGLAATHGSPMGEVEVAKTKSALGLNPDLFFQIPAQAAANSERIAKIANQHRAEYDQEMQTYAEREPELSRQYSELWNLDLSQIELPKFDLGSSIATRKASQQVLEALAGIEQIVGGSADLSESNGVAVKALSVYHGSSAKFGEVAGRRILFGIREHAMAAFNNGVALSSPLRPFGATFLIFADYMRPSIRLACLMNLPVTWVFSHDSVGLGEDGPTHQPVEHLWALRAIPNISVVRPADANETAAAWLEILKRKGPTALVLTRQNLPTIAEKPAVEKGAYAIFEPKTAPKIIVIATGSEVQIAVAAATALAEQNIAIRVISAPCLEWFDSQSQTYKNSLLKGAPKIAIEAGSTIGWWKYVGATGTVLGIDHYGASATPASLFNKFGITVENLITEVKKLA